MIIWGAYALALITLGGLLVWRRHCIVWWEAAILLVAPLALVVGARQFIEYVQTQDSEYWGGYALNVYYDEPWDEYIHKTCSRECCCSTDTKGNRSCSTEYYDCSYVDYHPAAWELKDSNGRGFNITRERFEELAARWQSRQFVEMNRNYHSLDGNRYMATWSGAAETIEPTATEHYYTNRVAVSDSIFRFPTVDPKTYGLFEYPGIYDGYKQQVVLGYKGADGVEAERKFEFINAMLGRKKQLRVFVLVFADKPLEAGMDQEAYWQGGNKNEFIVAVGTDAAGTVRWAYPFSWTEVDSLKIDARNYFVDRTGQPLALSEFADWLGPHLDERWVRLEFARWQSLAIDPPTWTIIVTYVLTVGMCAGIAYWCVHNEYKCESATGSFAVNRSNIYRQ